MIFTLDIVVHFEKPLFRPVVSFKKNLFSSIISGGNIFSITQAS